jgi:hypothetical protein
MEATAAQRDGSAAATAADTNLHRTQPLMHSLLQDRPGSRWVQLHQWNISF